MGSYRKLCCEVLTVLTLSVLVSLPASAQGPVNVSAQNQATATPAPDPPPPPPATSGDDGWRGQIAIYGWFPGIHGTVGVLGHDAGIHVPFSDVFHTLKGIIPIAVELDKRRLVIPVDYFWVKLGDDRGIPFNELGQTSVNIHLTESIFTPKIGYRLVNAEHFKIDALAGIRYWYVGQNLTVEPAGLGRSRSGSWVDGLGGARFIVPLGEKASITAAGDAGAGGANLDYQAVGLLNYALTPKWGASVGWRYLYVNYRPTNHEFIFNTAMTGLVAGFSYSFGGKPPVPPAAMCSVSPTEIFPGDQVTATINPQYFNPKHTLSYQWNSSGGKISGTGTTPNLDTTGGRTSRAVHLRRIHRLRLDRKACVAAGCIILLLFWICCGSPDTVAARGQTDTRIGSGYISIRSRSVGIGSGDIGIRSCSVGVGSARVGRAGGIALSIGVLRGRGTLRRSRGGTNGHADYSAGGCGASSRNAVVASGLVIGRGCGRMIPIIGNWWMIRIGCLARGVCSDGTVSSVMCRAATRSVGGSRFSRSLRMIEFARSSGVLQLATRHCRAPGHP